MISQSKTLDKQQHLQRQRVSGKDAHHLRRAVPEAAAVVYQVSRQRVSGDVRNTHEDRALSICFVQD